MCSGTDAMPVLVVTEGHQGRVTASHDATVYVPFVTHGRARGQVHRASLRTPIEVGARCGGGGTEKVGGVPAVPV